jgi:hypothetical protein
MSREIHVAMPDVFLAFCAIGQSCYNNVRTSEMLFELSQVAK